jgi:hypothetical protein
MAQDCPKPSVSEHASLRGSAVRYRDLHTHGEGPQPRCTRLQSAKEGSELTYRRLNRAPEGLRGPRTWSVRATVVSAVPYKELDRHGAGPQPRWTRDTVRRETFGSRLRRAEPSFRRVARSSKVARSRDDSPASALVASEVSGIFSSTFVTDVPPPHGTRRGLWRLPVLFGLDDPSRLPKTRTPSWPTKRTISDVQAPASIGTVRAGSVQSPGRIGRPRAPSRRFSGFVAPGRADWRRAPVGG